MERFQVENLYKVNGLDDYRLRNTSDLLKVHGIDYRAIRGYDGLDDINKAVEYLQYTIEQNEIDNDFDFTSYIPPEEYPDWDGDESIMHYLDHFAQEDDDEVICECCGNYIAVYGNEVSFICPECGTLQNI
jgi:hypothetical protein